MRDNRKAALFVSNWFSVLGQQYSGYTPQLVSKLQERGWQVTAASARPQRVVRLFDMCLTAWRARHNYNVAQIDIFSGPAFLWAEAVVGMLRLLRKPYILTLHGGNLPAFARRWPGRIRRLLMSATAVTTPSRYLLEQMARYRTDVILLPYALDLSHYHPRLPDQSVQPRLVWLRAFHAIYNPVLAAQTVARLKDEFPSLRLTMIGPDKKDGTLQAFQRAVYELGVDGHVDWPGGVPKADVPLWLQRGDIFLNTTTAESFGVSVMEAAAMGLCIVTTNVGELSYLWEDGVDALLVPPNDPDAMAAAVRRILTEPDLAARLSRNARRKAEQFDWETILPQWERLLTEVAARGCP